MVLDGPALIQWVNASCIAQGVPLLVTDIGVVTRVCALLGAGSAGDGRRMRRRDPATGPSEGPDGDDSIRVEGVDPLSARQDGDVGDDGLDDGGLAVEVES